MNNPSSLEAGPNTFKRRPNAPTSSTWFSAMRKVMSKLLDNSRVRHDDTHGQTNGFGPSLNSSNHKSFSCYSPTRCLMVPEDAEDSGDELPKICTGASESKSEIPPIPFHGGQTPRMNRVVNIRKNCTSAKWATSCRQCNTLMPNHQENRNKCHLRRSTPENWLQSERLQENLTFCTAGSDFEVSPEADEAIRYAEYITRTMEQEQLLEAAERQRREMSRFNHSPANSQFTSYTHLSSLLTISSPERSQLTNASSFSDLPNYFFGSQRNLNGAGSISPLYTDGESSAFRLSPINLRAHENVSQRDSGNLTDSYLDLKRNLKVPEPTRCFQRTRSNSDWMSKRRSMLNKYSAKRQPSSQQSTGIIVNATKHCNNWVSFDSGTEKSNSLIRKDERDGGKEGGVPTDPTMLYRFNPRRLLQLQKTIGEFGKLTSNYETKTENNKSKTLLCSSWPLGISFHQNDLFSETTNNISQLKTLIRNNSFEFNIPLNDIAFDRCIKKGNRCGIHRGNWHGEVTVHTFHKLNQQERKRFWEQVSKLSMIRHENIALFMGACMDPPRFAIVMNAYDGPTLYYVLHVAREKIETSEKMYILQKLSEAVSYLHANAKKIVIKCLNAHNIIMRPKLTLSLLDHNQNDFKTDKSGYLTVPSKLVWYTAPELLQAAKASQLTYSTSLFNSPEACLDSSSTEAVYSLDNRPSTIGLFDMSSPFSSTETISSHFEQAAYQYGCEQREIMPSTTHWMPRRRSMSNYIDRRHGFAKFSLKIFPWNLGRSNSLPQLTSSSNPIINTEENIEAISICNRNRINRSVSEMVQTSELKINFPLVMPEQCFTRATDIYALGTIIYEVFAHSYPMQATPASEYVSYVACGHQAGLDSLSAPMGIKSIISECWSYDPCCRPAISTLVHQWVYQRRRSSSDQYSFHRIRSTQSFLF